MENKGKLTTKAENIEWCWYCYERYFTGSLVCSKIFRSSNVANKSEKTHETITTSVQKQFSRVANASSGDEILPIG